MIREVALAALIGMGSSSVALADDPFGRWQMEGGKVTVQVSNCGGSLCGRIVALKKPLDKHGNPKVDKDNPDPSLRMRPVIGLSLFRDMKRTADNQWQGVIYVPDDGRTYNAIVYISGDVMKVKGCVMVFCRAKTFQ